MSGHISVQRVLAPSDELVDSAVALMVAAMDGDACMLAMCGGDYSIFHHLARAMIREGINWGEFWIAQDGQQLVGFMTWNPPGSEPRIPQDKRAELNAPFYQAVSEEGRAYARSVFTGEFPEFVARCIGPMGKHDGWWLRIAMVKRSHQGRGIARKLYEPMRRKVAERGEYIALSTTAHRNVAIYKALGFELRGFRTFPSPWGEWPLYVFRQKP